MFVRQFFTGLLFLLAPIALFAGESATSGAASPQEGGFSPIIFLVVILAFMYFLVWRPQQKKAKQHRLLIAAVAVGDEVLLNSGIVGKVAETYEQYLSVTLSDGVNIILQRAAVGAVLPKGSIESLKKPAAKV